MLAARSRVDGLVIQAPLIHDWRIGVLRELGLPYVVHGRFSDEDQTYSWVDMDNRRAFRRATEHLLDLGHSRIALLNGIRGMDFAERRADGFLQALRARGLEPPPAYFCNSRMTETYGYEAATTLLRSEMPPTALITSSVIVAMGVRRSIEAQGLRMGRDLSVVTHDDVLTYLLNDGAPPVFTAIRSPVRDAAERAIENLLTLIEDPSAGPIQTLLEAELVPGGSSGPAPTNPPQGRTHDAYQI
jgi:LacI family transcriptional regulator